MKLILVSALFFISASLPGNSDCDSLKIKANITNTSNNQANGAISVEVVNGKPPYKVFLFADKRKDNRLDVGIDDLVDLPAGKYILVIQEGGGCAIQENLTVK